MILLQEDQMSKIRLILQDQLNTLRIWHISYVAMILTGLLYPVFAQYSIPQIMIGVFTYWGFVAWAVAMVLCGIGGLLQPQRTMLWLSALFPFLIAVSIYAFRDTFALLGIDALIFTDAPSFTALIYYSSFYLFTLYFWWKANSQQSVLLKHIPITRIAGILHLLFGLVLLIHPKGSGLELFYEFIDSKTFGLIDPITAYQMIYLVSGAILTAFPVFTRGVLQLLTAPFIIHGVGFIGVILGMPEPAWSFVPFFVAVSALWFHIGGGQS